MLANHAVLKVLVWMKIATLELVDGDDGAIIDIGANTSLPAARCWKGKTCPDQTCPTVLLLDITTLRYSSCRRRCGEDRIAMLRMFSWMIWRDVVGCV